MIEDPALIERGLLNAYTFPIRRLFGTPLV